MSNQPYIFSRPAARQVITILMTVMVSIIAIGYGLLWLYADQQRRILGNIYIADVITELNHKIDNDELDLQKDAFIKPENIQSYQIVLFEPTGNTVNITNNGNNASTLLPSWTLVQHDNDKVFYHFDNLEAWQNLHQNYRVYIKIEFNSFWNIFVNPLYLLPLLLFFTFLLLAIITLRKRYLVWSQITGYLDNLQGNIANGYQPLFLSHHYNYPELHHLVQLLNRFSFKISQYFNQVNELTYRQNTLIDKSPVLLFLINRKGRLVYFNEKFSQSFNTSFNQDIVYMLSDFITGMDKATQLILTNISEVHSYTTLSVTNLQRDMYFDLRLNPFYNRLGQLQGYSGGLEIVTEYHEKLQQAWVDDKQTAEKLASFNKLWAILGHELRTPLSGMAGMIDLLAEDKTQFNEDQQETVMTLQQSSQSMIQLLNDMLDVAKLEAGKLQTNITSVDLLQVLRQVSELMICNARRQKISLYIFPDPLTPRYIDCDEGRLRQILLNLLSNAVKFTQHGYVAIIVDRIDSSNNIIQQKKSATQNLANDWLRITCKDTGLGIEDKDKQKLFSFFNQANDSISRQFGGTGLGLAISNNFSQLLGGFIHLESEINKGSEFQVYLPIKNYSIQPVFQFNTSSLPIILIIISPFEIMHLLQRILNFIELPYLIFTEIDQKMVDRLNGINLQNLTPTFIVDDEGYINHKSMFSKITMFKDAIKIVASIESQRTLSSELLIDFDGFLQKPVTLSNMMAEITHLYENKNKQSKKIDTLPAPLAFSQFLHQHKDVLEDNSIINHNKTIAEIVDAKQTDTLSFKLSTHNSLIEEDVKTLTTASIKTTSSKSILVAEDNPANQKIAKKHITSLGYDVIIAPDGEQAIKLLNENRDKIGLVLMDCRMPILEGIEATRIIRIHKDSIPIIALTANDTDEDRQFCLNAGMDDFLTKPLNKQKLIEVINRYMI